MRHGMYPVVQYTKLNCSQFIRDALCLEERRKEKKREKSW